MRSVSARLMISTASSVAPASCGVDNVRLWSGASMATIRTGTASSAFFGEGSDDTKTVALHRVIGDPRHIAEIDDPALEGLEPLGVCRADRQQRERGGKGGLLDIHGSFPMCVYMHFPSIARRRRMKQARRVIREARLSLKSDVPLIGPLPATTRSDLIRSAIFLSHWARAAGVRGDPLDSRSEDFPYKWTLDRLLRACRDQRHGS
jgi:hypothetical protein